MIRLRWMALVAIGAAPVATSTVWSQSPGDSLPRVLQQVRQFSAAYSTPDSARIRNFIRLRPISRVPGLNPFVGEHWFRPGYLRLAALDLAKPAYLMFYPIDGAERLVGVGYALNQPSGAPPPPDFAGSAQHWHLHHPCTALPGIGSLLLGGAKECKELGGKPGDNQIVMLHVWLESNPDGEFGSENPALPFLATGLKPPDSIALADHARSTRLRTLGLALGETIGARPRYGTMPEFGVDSLRFRRRAGRLRAQLLVLADSLRAAEQLGDTSAYTRSADTAVATWGKLRQVYLELAPGKVARTLMERWFEAVLNPGHGPGH